MTGLSFDIDLTPEVVPELSFDIGLSSLSKNSRIEVLF